MRVSDNEFTLLIRSLGNYHKSENRFSVKRVLSVDILKIILIHFTHMKLSTVSLVGLNYPQSQDVSL